MDTIWKTIIWQQFGASIDMLENALLACPDEIWGDRSQQTEYWYLVYHTLFWLDLYLSGSLEGFVPPAPFTLDELDPTGLMPERVYAKEELQTYLRHCRRKCQATIEVLTDEKANELFVFGRSEFSFAELREIAESPNLSKLGMNAFESMRCYTRLARLVRNANFRAWS